MKKQFRVLKNQEFQEIIKTKNFLVEAPFTLYIRKRKLAHSRIGIGVGKRLGHAVIRNKIKRQVRMMVNAIWNYDEDFDCIVMIGRQYQIKEFHKNQEILKKAYKKVKMRNVVSKGELHV